VRLKNISFTNFDKIKMHTVSNIFPQRPLEAEKITAHNPGSVGKWKLWSSHHKILFLVRNRPEAQSY
jgi:hypothetical protein